MSGQVSNSDEYVIDDPVILEAVEKYVDWATLPKRHFIQRVEEGRLGKNIGVDNGMVKLNNYTRKTQRGTYYLIGADSGVGKSTLTDFMFVLKAYEDCKRSGKKLYIYYYSFEISKYMKELKWVAFYVFIKFGIMFPTDYIAGKVEGKAVIEEHMKMIRIAYAYVEQLINSIVFIEDPLWPTAIWVQMIEHFDTIGTIHRGKPKPGHTQGPITGWTPKPGEEDSMTLGILDHGALLMSENSMDTKRTMDLMSKYIVIGRNLFDLSWAFVQQFNSELVSLNRDSYKKTTEASVLPQRLDFGDSTYTFRDAEIVLGLISPAKFDMPKFMGYDVTKLNSHLIILALMKNRYGQSGLVMPLFINPIAGTFYDLALSESPAMEDISKQLKLIQECQLNYQQPK